jgi:hypothetical protein
VAEPDHVRVALPTSTWLVDHGPSIGNYPKGSLTGQLWPSPGRVHAGGVRLGLWSLNPSVP